MANEYSDVDVYVVLEQGDSRWKTLYSSSIDVPVCTVAELRVVPGIESDGWWERYAFAHADVLVDRLAGEIARLVQRWAKLTEAESRAVLDSRLDSYIIWVYRSLKSHRDGRRFEVRLDAVESLSWGLMVVFALQQRVRPYSKYLRWELEHYPLDGMHRATTRLLDLHERILDHGSAQAQRELFGLIEVEARKAGQSKTIDAWGDELTLLRDGSGRIS